MDRNFEPTGDIVVDTCRLLARAGMRLSRVKPATERQQQHYDDALEYLGLARDMLNEWDDHRLDEIADDAAIGALVERHVDRILKCRAD